MAGVMRLCGTKGAAVAHDDTVIVFRLFECGVAFFSPLCLAPGFGGFGGVWRGSSGDVSRRGAAFSPPLTTCYPRPSEGLSTPRFCRFVCFLPLGSSKFPRCAMENETGSGGLAVPREGSDHSRKVPRGLCTACVSRDGEAPIGEARF